MASTVTRVQIQLSNVVKQMFCIVYVEPTNLQPLRNAVMSVWTKTSEECFPRILLNYHTDLSWFWKQNGFLCSTSNVYAMIVVQVETIKR